jgi:hypothetical protein
MDDPARRRNLERLLSPKSIAVVGGRFAENVIRQTRRIGFSGPIWAVNPKRESLAGVPCPDSRICRQRPMPSSWALAARRRWMLSRS